MYYTIHSWMASELGLSGVKKEVYAVIYSFSRDGAGSYTGGNSYLADAIGVSERAVILALNSLVDSRIIARNEPICDMVKTKNYTVLVVEGGEKLGEKGVKNFQGGGEKFSPNNKSNNKDINNIVFFDEKSENKKAEIEKVVTCLNEATNGKFTTKNKANATTISARLDEGYTSDDLCCVIECKAAQWVGTDMAKYLRPSTLFCPKHFEGYLSECGRAEVVAGSPEHQKYLDTVKEKYVSLWNSSCRVLSGDEYNKYKAMLTGAQRLSPMEIKTAMQRTHSRIDTDAVFRRWHNSVWEAFQTIINKH